MKDNNLFLIDWDGQELLESIQWFEGRGTDKDKKFVEKNYLQILKQAEETASFYFSSSIESKGTRGAMLEVLSNDGNFTVTNEDGEELGQFWGKVKLDV